MSYERVVKKTPLIFQKSECLNLKLGPIITNITKVYIMYYKSTLHTNNTLINIHLYYNFKCKYFSLSFKTAVAQLKSSLLKPDEQKYQNI